MIFSRSTSLEGLCTEKLRDGKAKHLTQNINLRTDALFDLLHIGHAVQSKMKADTLPPLVHVLDNIHILRERIL